MVARAFDILSIGVDIDSDESLSDELARIVCTPAELLGAAHMSKVLFVVKEAVYKMYFPLIGHFVDFHDLEVQLDMHAGRFTAQFSPSCPGVYGERRFGGRFAKAAGAYVALAALPVSGDRECAGPA